MTSSYVNDKHIRRQFLTATCFHCEMNTPPSESTHAYAWRLLRPLSERSSDCISEIRDQSTRTEGSSPDETVGIKCQNAVEIWRHFDLTDYIGSLNGRQLYSHYGFRSNSPHPHPLDCVCMTFGKRIRWEIDSESRKFADESAIEATGAPEMLMQVTC